MTAFIEKFLFAVCVGVFLGAVVFNTMHLNATQRAGLGTTLVGLALFLGGTLSHTQKAGGTTKLPLSDTSQLEHGEEANGSQKPSPAQERETQQQPPKPSSPMAGIPAK